MIVVDTSTLVSATFRRRGIPAQAVRRALQTDRTAVSEPVLAELLDVLHRPCLARFVDPEQRAALLSQLLLLGVRFAPLARVTDCRDPKDNMCLDLALAAEAALLVSSDDDLLVLHPWRGLRILRPAQYLGKAVNKV